MTPARTQNPRYRLTVRCGGRQVVHIAHGHPVAVLPRGRERGYYLVGDSVRLMVETPAGGWIVLDPHPLVVADCGLHPGGHVIDPKKLAAELAEADRTRKRSCVVSRVALLPPPLQ